jgi:hypothetical protein
MALSPMTGERVFIDANIPIPRAKRRQLFYRKYRRGRRRLYVLFNHLVLL